MHAVIILFKNINHSTISRCAPRTSRHGKRNTRVHLIDFPAINKPLTFWFYLMFPFPFCICCRGPRLRVLLVCRRLEALRSEGPFVIILHSNPEAARAAPAIKMISSQPAKLASNQRSTLIAVRSSSGSTLETPGFDKGCKISPPSHLTKWACTRGYPCTMIQIQLTKWVTTRAGGLHELLVYDPDP